jgi:hypothetical protein
MSPEAKTALTIGAAAFGLAAAGVALTGRSTSTSLACGAIVGAAAWGFASYREPVLAATARPNISKYEIEHGYGSLTPPALRLLSRVNSDDLFAPQTTNGWVIGDVPANEYEVRQLP